MTTVDLPAFPEPSSITPHARLGATRSSHRWTDMPGNWDRLNTRALYPAANPWGIPDLPASRFIPARLVAYNDRHACRTAGPDTAVHFFLDDYRFETIWTKPERGLSRTQSVGAALTPDFSLWTDMPLAMQLWQVYRSRWCGAWMTTHGVKHVIPTISWSTPDSYPFAFTGIPTGSVVAVSTVGVQRHQQATTLFAQGFTEMVTRLQPSTVLVYGTPPTEQQHTGVPIRHYPTRWQHIRQVR